MLVSHSVGTPQVPLWGDSPWASSVSSCFASRGPVCALFWIVFPRMLVQWTSLGGRDRVFLKNKELTAHYTTFGFPKLSIALQ